MAGKKGFGEEPDRTVIVPNPQGRRNPAAGGAPVAPPSPQPPAPQGPVPPAPTPQAQAPDPFAGLAAQPAAPIGVPQGQYGGQFAGRAPQAAPEAAVSQALTGMNPINASASVLFSLVSRIRNRAQHSDPDGLRRSVIGEVQAFEKRLQAAGTDPQTIRIARYAICATLDDVVLNTPWGGQSSWAQQSMVGTFHKETFGGDRLYDLLVRLQKDPAQNLALLEFLYVCLTLGFEGRLRADIDPSGPEKHLTIRQNLARLIRTHRGDVEWGLSPHWPGEAVAFRPRNTWLPVWVTAGVLALILGLSFFGLSFALSGTTDRLAGELIAIDSGAAPVLERRAPPPPPPPPAPTAEEQLEKVRGFLVEEIAAGLVTVFPEGNTLTIRIVGTGMFASGSDSLQPAFGIPLERVAKALNDEPGPVIIAGHSDNVPINTARFPSNLHLSLARAKSVMQEMAVWMAEPERMSAEGRADKEPIASNDTAEGRAENRRIEVILVKEEVVE